MNERKTYFVSRISYHVLPHLGFTLIELLVVVSLIGILSAIGLASYINFNRNQLVIQATRKIVQDLRLAQSLAANNQKPSGDCTVLNSYIFKLDSINKEYRIEVECTPPYVDNPIKSGDLPKTLVISGFTQVKFKILRQGVSLTGGSSLAVSGFGKTKTINVEEGGTINISGE